MNKTTLFSLLILALSLCSLPVSALKLRDGENYVYDMQQDGALNRGSAGAYANMYRLRVNGTNYSGQPVSVARDGRKIFSGIFVEPGSGLEISRQLYVPRRSNFARYMEVIHNPTPATQSLSVEIFGKLGTPSPQVLFDQGFYLITDDFSAGENSGSPVLLHYHSQIGGPLRATHSLAGNSLSWIYPTINVPPQTTVRFIHFVAQAKTFRAARNLAETIFSNDSLLYDSISPAARSELVNFIPLVSVETGDFSNAPLLGPGEVRNGILHDTDPSSHIRSSSPADAYSLRLNAGDTVTLRMAAPFDTFLYLFDDVAGTLPSDLNNDANPRTTNSELVIRATTSHTYYIEAGAYEKTARGGYTLEVFKGTENKPPMTAPIEYTYGRLIAPANVRFTDFSIDLDGQIVEYCWDFGDGSDILCSPAASVTHTFSEAGHYTVGVRLRDNQGGISQHSERVSIRTAQTAVILPLDSVVDGELVFGDEYSITRTGALTDRYQITSLPPGQEVVIDMVSNDVDSYLYLYDANHQRLRQDDNSGGAKNARLIFVAGENGDLFLEATSVNNNSLGAYRLSLKLNNPANELVVPVERFAAAGNLLTNYFILRLPENISAGFLSWDFGDNSPFTSTSGTIATHTYKAPGNYHVKVTARSGDGRAVSGNTTFSINTQNAALNAKFRVSPVFGDKPLRVFFSNESVSSLTGDKLTYLWDFGDGTVSTEPDPDHTYTRPNTYNVILTVTSGLTGQSASVASQVIVIERNKDNIPVSDTARLRPQVVLAGFDPILVDMADTSLTVFAIVRPGAAPLQSVLIHQNPGILITAMHHASTYTNGDQRYEAVIPFHSGAFATGSLSDLFGTGPDHYTIQAIDQGGQFHSFPVLEFGNYPVINSPADSRYAAPVIQAGIRRNSPQVLGAGFGTPLVDLDDTQVEVLALVRAGLKPLTSVSLLQNGSETVLPMRVLDTLPNGDQIYSVEYTYPKGFRTSETFGKLFGTNAGEFKVQAVDQSGQSHAFPDLKFGNYPQR